MIIIQKFHSLNEIDIEFRQTLSLFVKDEFPDFEHWLKAEESLPIDITLHYYLFFGNQHNLPVGIAVLKLTPLDPQDYLPFFKRMWAQFFQDSTPMKHAKWCVGTGSLGSLIVHPRFWRESKEEFQKLLFSVEERDDILSQTIVETENHQKHLCHWDKLYVDQTIPTYFLSPYEKKQKSYEEFISHMNSDQQKMIKSAWKSIYKNKSIDIKDDESTLSFTRDDSALLTMPYLNGLEGRLFVELNLNTYPEIQLFQRVQYALMKFFEEQDAYTLVLTNNGSPLSSTNDSEWSDLLELGFTQVERTFHHLSRSPYVR